MDQIQKVSAVIVRLIRLLLIIIPLIIIFGWVFIDTPFMKNLIAQGIILEPLQTPEGTVYFNQVSWAMLSKIVGFGAHGVGFLPLFLSLFALKSIFNNYTKSEIFTTLNARHYRYLGWLFFLDALIAKPLGGMLMVMAVTLSQPSGHRYIVLDFGTPNLSALFCGIVMIVISWVMLEASKLQTEQELTI